MKALTKGLFAVCYLKRGAHENLGGKCEFSGARRPRRRPPLPSGRYGRPARGGGASARKGRRRRWPAAPARSPRPAVTAPPAVRFRM
eukprot:900433-Prorocentrum_minimum.AAC.1